MLIRPQAGRNLLICPNEVFAEHGGSMPMLGRTLVRVRR